ncbi:MAG TPA: signal peptidase I, partial [Micrococcus luteus]|nr:signal peptidase I [Micrococcus luteus]
MAERVEPAHGDDVDGGAGAAGQPRRPRLPFWASLLLNVVVAIAVVAVVQALWVKVYSVPSGSMENTLEVGDRMLVNRTAYPDGMADSQDVVVFTA